MSGPQHPESLLAPLEDSALRASLGGRTLEAGHGYARAGRVRRIVLGEDGRTVIAETRGTAPHPYRQRITLLPDRAGRVQVHGVCSCPVGGNCKHVAAVLLTLRERLPAPPPAPRTEAPLSPMVAEWLAALGRSEEDPEAFPAGTRQRLVYLLDIVPQPRAGERLDIACLTVPLRKDGSFGTPRPYMPHQVDTPAGYLRPSDPAILRRLARLPHWNRDPAADDDPADLLRRILATGRARWAAVQGPALREGPERPGRIAWRMLADGRQVPGLVLEDGLLGFRMGGPCYVDPATGLVGKLATGVARATADRVLAAPPIPAAEIPRVIAALAGAGTARGVPAPADPGPPETVAGPPVPSLLLTSRVLEVPRLRYGRGQAFPAARARMPLARLAFRYGRVELPPFAQGPDLHAQDGRLFRVERDRAAEGAALVRLQDIGFAPARDVFGAFGGGGQDGDFVLGDDGEDSDWLSVVIDEVPDLRASGWSVAIADDFPVRLVEPEGGIEAELREGSGIDWLDLHLGVTVAGERIDLVPPLLALLAEADAATLLARADDAAPLLLPLEDGRLLSLPLGRVRPIVEALLELFAGGGIDPAEGRIGFSRLDAAELALLEERGVAWQGGEAVRALGRQLRDAGGTIPPAAVPASFRGKLRPYQAQGVAWLQFLRAAGLGGVLADDMGLGKTVQTLAHLCIEQAEARLDRPALIVCPTSLVPNWTMEAARFAPTLKLLALHGPARKARFAEIAAHDLVLTTYPLLARDHAVLTAQDWHAVVLDEAQTIRNPNAETTRQALRLRARQRLCLSGTPLQNHLGELWSLFDFLAPAFLGSAQAFRRRYRTPIEKQGDTARQSALARRVRPFLLRRTKDEVVRDLPPKTEIAEPVDLGAAQRAIYESVRLAMHRKVRAAIAEKGLARSAIVILDALLKLRQACCDPRLLKLKAAERANAGSAKLERLMELLAMMLEEGRRVLVFSQFTSMLALIAARLQAAGIAHLVLTGDTVDRSTPVQRFQGGAVPVFLVSLKAGGVGLNLTAADTVIHYDPWWNPAAEDQATDRAHRIGQEKPVFVHRLIALGTIEEKMQVLKQRKRALAEAVLLAGEGSAPALSEADIEALLGSGA